MNHALSAGLTHAAMKLGAESLLGDLIWRMNGWSGYSLQDATGVTFTTRGPNGAGGVSHFAGVCAADLT